jgi:hypothetical protein
MKKISLLLSVLFFSFLIGCKSIDEPVQPDAAKSKQSKTMRLQGIPEGNGQTTFALGGISGECRQFIFNDPNRPTLGGREGLLAVRAITWTEGFMQGKFDIHDSQSFLSEPFRSYELMLATAVASKEGWEDGGDLKFGDRLYLGLSPMTRVAGYPCNNNYNGEQDTFAYYSTVVNRGWLLWYNNQQLSFEQLADLVELELQKSEFVTFIGSEGRIESTVTNEYEEAFFWQDLDSGKFRELCNNNGVLSRLIQSYLNRGLSPSPAYGLVNVQYGRIFEDAVLRSLNLKGRDKLFPVNDPTLTPQSVRPDAVVYSGRVDQERRGGKIVSKASWWKDGTFIDAKFTTTGIVPYERQGNSPDQAAGFLDVLSRLDQGRFTYGPVGAFTDFGGTPFVKNAAQAGCAFLMYVTPSNVNIDNQILSEASQRNIMVLQAKVKYNIYTNNIAVNYAYPQNTVNNYPPTLQKRGQIVDINYNY